MSVEGITELCVEFFDELVGIGDPWLRLALVTPRQGYGNNLSGLTDDFLPRGEGRRTRARVVEADQLRPLQRATPTTSNFKIIMPGVGGRTAY
ncbi:hypothetical protein QFZ82_000380 [Streptomyces sp. V4I23]|nr:hypothetical protein [Streptomyces sp. V4I23]